MASRADRRSPSPTALTAVCIVGLSMSASILVLLVPSPLRPEAQIHPLVVVGLVALCVAFTTGARYWRPQAPQPDLSS